MIINVSNGQTVVIPGITDEARVTFRGDEATVSTDTNNLTALPFPRQKVEFLEDTWEVIRTLSRTRGELTFLCRRLANG